MRIFTIGDDQLMSVDRWGKRAITCSADLGYVDRICNRDLLGVNKVAVYRHGYRYACSRACVCRGCVYV